MMVRAIHQSSWFLIFENAAARVWHEAKPICLKIKDERIRTMDNSIITYAPEVCTLSGTTISDIIV